MRISRIYTEEDLAEDCSITLDKAASSYLLKVLRLNDGTEVHVFNGKAISNNYGYYKATIHTTGKQAKLTCQQFVINNNQSPLKICLFQGISKGDHMDTTIQKAVELGVTEIIPVICERTVVNLKADRLEKKMRHWNGIVQSACEQSGRNQLLTIHTPIKYNQIQLSDNQTGFILDPDSGYSLLDSSATVSVAIIIGPEGGFTDKEVEHAINKGFKPVKFGPRILRTETAAIAAVSIIQNAWGDLS